MEPATPASAGFLHSLRALGDGLLATVQDRHAHQEEIIAALLKKIETLASQQSVTVTNVRPGDVEDKSNFRIYKTSIDCEGKLGNILSFVNLMEQSDYLFQVERYTMSPKSKGSEITKCTFDIARILITAENIDDLQGTKGS